MMKPTLFISYDGILDPLGSSQILPYVRSISQHPRPVHVISFEKPERLAQAGENISAGLKDLGISWSPLRFTRGFGKLGKLWDLLKMYLVAVWVSLRIKPHIIHCRSYQAMQVGLFLGRLLPVRTLFDMRGMWVDERVDGGLWSKDRLADRLAYALYKRIERRLLKGSTHVIALTERVVPELLRLAPGMQAPITVIPCCADFDHFRIQSAAERSSTRAALGLPEDSIVLAYLGSLGTWYLLEEMLQFFAKVRERWPSACFLIISRDWRDEHEEMLAHLGLQHLRSRMFIHPASRGEVPAYLGCADVMLSFIKPAYSKMASSPTKLAEAFAAGVPAISNAGIGDVDALTRRLDAGAIVDLAEQASLDSVVDHLDLVIAKGGEALRRRARVELGLEIAAASYRLVYKELECLP